MSVQYLTVDEYGAVVAVRRAYAPTTWYWYAEGD
jgi:hypothetical protein